MGERLRSAICLSCVSWCLSAVTAHRLVARVVREQLAAAGDLAAACQGAAKLLETEAGSLRDGWHADRRAARDLVGQIAALAEAATACADDDQLTRSTLMLRDLALSLLNKLGDSPDLAVTLGQTLAADCEAKFGASHPTTLSSHNNLAYAYWEAGLTSEAITLHERILADRERVLGSDHPDTLKSRSDLGDAYAAGGRTAEAVTLLTRALAEMKQILGDDHPWTKATWSSLISASEATGHSG